METVGRVLWLWYLAFSLPLFPKTPLSRKSRRGGKAHLSQKSTWVLAAVAHSHTACLLRAGGLKAGGQALCIAESRAHRRQPTNHGFFFPATCLLTGVSLVQASRKRELVAPGLELGCAAILRREGGQKGACEGALLDTHFQRANKSWMAHFWPELILLSQMGGGWGGPSYNPTFSSCSLNQLSPCQRREPVAQFHCNQK